MINFLKKIKKYLLTVGTNLRLAVMDLHCGYHRTVQITEDEATQIISKVYEQKPCGIMDNQIRQEPAADILLSIIIPVYNGELFLKECLDSILGQKTQYSFEVICVDDGSTDSSPEVLRGYQHRQELNVITQANGGISCARNRGLALARGRYIMFVDNDDVLAPGFLEHMLSNAVETNASIVKCGYQVLHEGTLKREYIESKNCVLTGHDLNRIYSFNGFCWGTLFERDLLCSFSFPQGYWYEDMVTRLVLYPRCKVFSYVGEALYYYRFHSNNASGKIWNKQNCKALDQYYLSCQCYDAAAQTGNTFTAEFCLAMQYELSIMLYHRTLGLDAAVREAVFVLACNLNDSMLLKCPDYSVGGSRCQRMIAESMKHRDFAAWNRICDYAIALY